MASRKYRQRFIRLTDKSGEWRVDPSLRSLLVAAAEEEGSSLTGVVTRILCEAYGIAYTPSGRAGRPSPDADEIVVQLPDALDHKIEVSAARNRRKVQDEILAALSAHYALPMPVAA